MVTERPYGCAPVLERPPHAAYVRRVRKALRLSQAAFAAKFGVRERTVRYWESGERKMGWRCQLILQEIVYDPELEIFFRLSGILPRKLSES